MLPTRPRRHVARLVLSTSTALAVATALVLTGAVPSVASTHRSFPGSKPAWAKASAEVGAPPVDDLLEGEIQLQLRDPAGAQALATAVSTPGNPQYAHPVTPAAWIARFSPSVATYEAAVQYVRSYGLTVIGTPKSRLFVVYRGTATQMDRAFSTTMRAYRHEGHSIVAPSTAPQLPVSVAAQVIAVNLVQQRHVASNQPAAAASSTDLPTIPVPCSAYWTQHQQVLPVAFGRTVFNTANCGYTGPQFRSAYQVPASLTGAGQTIATIIWYRSPTIVQDVDEWSARHGTAPLRHFREIDPPNYYNQDQCGAIQDEENIDNDAIHGMAPDANLLFVSAADCDYTVDTALSTILDDRLATIVSNSYAELGEPTPDQVLAEQNQALQAAAEGIGLYYSTGDDGDDTDQGIAASANYPGTSPWVTAVGGTSTEISRAGGIALQTGWGDAVDPVVESNGKYAYYAPVPGPFYGGANGGVSTEFAEPTYQRGVVPSSIAQGQRAVPDISADADPYTGLVIGYRPLANGTSGPSEPYQEFTYGGTSLAAPLVAAEMLLVQQQIGHPIGFANPALYAADRADSHAFTDVTHRLISVAAPYGTDASLVTNELDSSLTSAPGWDDVTGIGTFGVPGLVGALKR